LHSILLIMALFLKFFQMFFIRKISSCNGNKRQQNLPNTIGSLFPLQFFVHEDFFTCNRKPSSALLVASFATTIHCLPETSDFNYNAARRTTAVFFVHTVASTST
jgi:hypothetical protein